MKLLNETPDEYIRYCRKSIYDQREFIQDLQKLYRKHQGGCSKPDCDLCDQFLEAIIEQERLLDSLNERYEKAKKGIYG